MRIAKHDIPARIDAPGAVARHLGSFGGTTDGPIAAEYFSLGAGVDIAPLLVGLDGDACQAPHWGYLITGEVVVTYTDGTEDRCVAGDVFHWPAGHSVRVVDDADVILFSPEHEHAAVIDHLKVAMGL
jgi:hypothetical protein